MNITQGLKGRFITRSEESSDLDPNLMTSILRVVSVSDDGSFTADLIHNCQPVHELSFPKEVNTGWHDVTDLVYEANSVIPLPASTCSYESSTAAMYRNFMKGLQSLKPLNPAHSVGTLCVIGTKSNNIIKFSATADQIIAIDDEGFVITYGGFCPHNVTEEDIVMRVVKINDATQAFYSANEVVKLSNTTHNEDLKTAYEMAITAKAAVAPKEVLKTVSEYQEIQRLNLPNAENQNN